MDYYDEPDPDNTDLNLPEAILPHNQSSNEFNHANNDTLSTPINTMSYFDEPDPNNHAAIQPESSTSPPPPSATLPDHSASAKFYFID